MPVTLVHMGVVHQFDVPHWAVVAQIGDGQVTFNDPYPPKGGKGLSAARIFSGCSTISGRGSA